MVGPKFDKIVLLASGKLLVEGPFETHGEVVDDVFVRIVIVAEDATPLERFGTATLPKSDVSTSGTGDDMLSRGRFSGTVDGSGLEVGDTVRAIGLSVAAKRADPPDPSAFEATQWCVPVEVSDGEGVVA
jgi:hypothetical protein